MAFKNVAIDRRLLTCNQCNWEWFTGIPDRPSVCPKCRSSKWDQLKRVKKEKKKEIVAVNG